MLHLFVRSQFLHWQQPHRYQVWQWFRNPTSTNRITCYYLSSFCIYLSSCFGLFLLPGLSNSKFVPNYIPPLGNGHAHVSLYFGAHVLLISNLRALFYQAPLLINLWFMNQSIPAFSRVRYCSKCKANIRGFDHHCPAFGNCIGTESVSLNPDNVSYFSSIIPMQFIVFFFSFGVQVRRIIVCL